jgi:hypothetical protein
VRICSSVLHGLASSLEHAFGILLTRFSMMIFGDCDECCFDLIFHAGSTSIAFEAHHVLSAVNIVWLFSLV